MSYSKDDIKKIVKDNAVEFISTRFTDMLGIWHHMTVHVDLIDDVLDNGVAFDGSSISGWRSINNSDMLMKPDLETAFVDPFIETPTLILICDVYEPTSSTAYTRCPRSIAKKAIEFLAGTGIGDTCYFGAEPEFFVFDDVKVKNTSGEAGYKLGCSELPNFGDQDQDGGNSGHRPYLKGGYVPVAPVDHTIEQRNQMVRTLKQVGMEVERHHHEVASAQHEIGIKFDTLVGTADNVQKFKYVVRNTAQEFGQTATFMPKPLAGDNGSGMHCHQSVWKAGKNTFAGDVYEHLSQEALWYIGGIIKHGRAINAFTNPGTNSYKRLVPGYEAPVVLAYAAKNRSVSIRIPHVDSENGRRIEARFPDPTSCSYLGMTAMLLAGLDGIKNKIDPGKATEDNAYQSGEELPTVAPSLFVALEELNADRSFLTSTGVFTDEFIDAYIDLKKGEDAKYRSGPHPIEFEMYYSL